MDVLLSNAHAVTTKSEVKHSFPELFCTFWVLLIIVAMALSDENRDMRLVRPCAGQEKAVLLIDRTTGVYRYRSGGQGYKIVKGADLEQVCPSR